MDVSGPLTANCRSNVAGDFECRRSISTWQSYSKLLIQITPSASRQFVFHLDINGNNYSHGEFGKTVFGTHFSVPIITYDYSCLLSGRNFSYSILLLILIVVQFSLLNCGNYKGEVYRGYIGRCEVKKKKIDRSWGGRFRKFLSN